MESAAERQYRISTWRGSRGTESGEIALGKKEDAMGGSILSRGGLP